MGHLAWLDPPRYHSETKILIIFCWMLQKCNPFAIYIKLVESPGKKALPCSLYRQEADPTSICADAFFDGASL